MNRPAAGPQPNSRFHNMVTSLISSYLFGPAGGAAVSSALNSRQPGGGDTQGQSQPTDDTYKVPTPEEEALKAQQATDPLFQYNGNYF